MTSVEKELEALKADFAGLQVRLRRIEKKLNNHRPKMPPWAPLYLEALQETGVVERAIEIVGCPSSKTTYYKHKEDCPEFDEAWEQALENHRLSVAESLEDAT